MIILEENYKNNNIKNSQYNNSLSKKLKKFFTYTKNKHIKAVIICNPPNLF